MKTIFAFATAAMLSTAVPAFAGGDLSESIGAGHSSPYSNGSDTYSNPTTSGVRSTGYVTVSDKNYTRAQLKARQAVRARGQDPDRKS